MEGREGEEQGPTSKGIGRGEKREGGGREERERKGGEQPVLTIKKSFPCPWPVSINLAARLKCYRRHGP